MLFYALFGLYDAHANIFLSVFVHWDKWGSNSHTHTFRFFFFFFFFIFCTNVDLRCKIVSLYIIFQVKNICFCNNKATLYLLSFSACIIKRISHRPTLAVHHSKLLSPSPHDSCLEKAESSMQGKKISTTLQHPRTHALFSRSFSHHFTWVLWKSSQRASSQGC